MLIIRKEQMKAFEQASIRNFEDQMVQHLEQFSPRFSKFIGEKPMREAIRLGFKRSATYGLTNRGPVRFYIEQMFIFGSYFDTDPQIPWAAEILKDTTITDQMERAYWLHKKTENYINEVAGPANHYMLNAIKGVRLSIDKSLPISFENFESDLLMKMQSNYPQKYRYSGDLPLRTLIRKGTGMAKSYSLQTIQGISLFVVLMFFFGHRFIEDPLFPSFARISNDLKIKDSEESYVKLKNKAIAYFNQILAVLEKGK